MNRRQIRIALIALLTGLTLVRLYYIQAIPLASDEANSWQWSRHLAFGYYDQGPLIAWLVKLGTLVLGGTVLGVRITALILGLGTSLLFYDFCRRVADDERLGLWLVIAANSTMLFTSGSIIQTYDTPQAFLWLLGLELTALAIFKDRPRAWYGAGAAAGLAMLAKYTSVLLPGLVFVFLLTNPRRRFWLKRKEPYLAALIAASIYSPNLFWNAAHHWVAFRHSLGLGGGEWIFTLHEFIGAQLAFLGPVLLVMIVIGLVLAFKMARRGDDLLAFLVWTSAPVLLLFAVLSVKSRVYGNWPAPGYIAAMLAAGLALKPRLTESAKWRRWAIAAVLSGYAIVVAAGLHAPIIRAVNLPPEMDPTMEIYGWPEMGREIGRVLDELPGDEKPFIFALRYQLASLAAFYTPGQPQTESLFVPGERLNAYLFWTDPRKLKGRNGLAVINLRNYRRPIKILKWLFERVTPVKKLDLVGPAGTIINRVGLYYCVNFKGSDARPAKFLAVFDEAEASDPGPIRRQND